MEDNTTKVMLQSMRAVPSAATIGTMPEKKVALNIRLPADLHEDLRQAAERDDRSLSNLIIHVLRAWRDEHGRPTGQTRRTERRSDPRS
jgi:hypothetical protein